MDTTQFPGLGVSTPAARLVHTESASTQVAAILRAEIQRGDHPPATRLRQRDVAARLGVSTTPVREAFQVLHAEGFLVVENHRGAVVVQPSEADIREGYAIRIALEGLAIRAAAEHFDAAQTGALRELVERTQQAADKDKWAALDHELHHRLNAMAGMPRLLGLIDSLRSGVAVYIESAFDDADRRQVADEEHAALLDACVAGDPDAAERIIRDHLTKTAHAIVSSLAEPQPGS